MYAIFQSRPDQISLAMSGDQEKYGMIFKMIKVLLKIFKSKYISVMTSVTLRYGIINLQVSNHIGSLTR